MTGLITVFKVIFGFLGVCLIGGIIFYILLDLKPWRKNSQLWDSKTDIGSAFHRSKIFAQQKMFTRNTWSHITSYYMYYVLAVIMLAIGFSQ
jgi:hypothetical protein